MFEPTTIELWEQHISNNYIIIGGICPGTEGKSMSIMTTSIFRKMSIIFLFPTTLSTQCDVPAWYYFNNDTCNIHLTTAASTEPHLFQLFIETYELAAVMLFFMGNIDLHILIYRWPATDIRGTNCYICFVRLLPSYISVHRTNNHFIGPTTQCVYSKLPFNQHLINFSIL